MNLTSIGTLAAGAAVGAVGSYSTYMLIGADKKTPSPGSITKAEVLPWVVGGTAAIAGLGGLASLIRTTDVGNTGPAFAGGLVIGGAVGWAAAGVSEIVKRSLEH